MSVYMNELDLKGFREPTKEEHSQLCSKIEARYNKAIGSLMAIIGIIAVYITISMLLSKDGLLTILQSVFVLVLFITLAPTVINNLQLGYNIKHNRYKVLGCHIGKIQEIGVIGQGYRKSNITVNIITDEKEECFSDFKFTDGIPYIKSNEELLLLYSGKMYELFKVKK